MFATPTKTNATANAAYPAGGITLADPVWEREADSAAEAAVSGRPAPVALRATAGQHLARQKDIRETKTTPVDKDGRKVSVTRVVTPGKCIEQPETRTSSETQITRTKATIKLSSRPFTSRFSSSTKRSFRLELCDPIKRFKDARSAKYEVKGIAPGGAEPSAELFGPGAKGEVSEKEMLKHLKEKLKAPKEGEKDPLAEEHVIGEGLPPDVRKEVEAEVKVFREGKREGKELKDRELLETIYRPLRRALIVLKPPAPPVELSVTSEIAEAIIGEPIDCLPEHEDLFDNTFQDFWYEGECKPKQGGVGSKVK